MPPTWFDLHLLDGSVVADQLASVGFHGISVPAGTAKGLDSKIIRVL
jgi:hypothetical protein